MSAKDVYLRVQDANGLKLETLAAPPGTASAARLSDARATGGLWLLAGSPPPVLGIEVVAASFPFDFSSIPFGPLTPAAKISWNLRYVTNPTPGGLLQWRVRLAPPSAAVGDIVLAPAGTIIDSVAGVPADGTQQYLSRNVGPFPQTITGIHLVQITLTQTIVSAPVSNIRGRFDIYPG